MIHTPHKIKVRKFKKLQGSSKNYRDWKEEGCLSSVGLRESVYATSNHGTKKTILDEAVEEDFNYYKALY